MSMFENKSKKTIVQDIINCFKAGPKANYFSINDNRRKVIVKRHVEKLQKEKHIIILEHYRPNTKKWEFVYADVTLIMKKNPNDSSTNKIIEEDYKYIGFDIIFSLTDRMIYKRIFINFSFHALLRFIERCNIKELSTPDKVKKFLSSMIRPIVLRCLSMYDGLCSELMHNKSNYDEIRKNLSKGSYIVANDVFMPIALEIGKNSEGKPSLCFTIKTIMPVEFNSAKRAIKKEEARLPKEKIFDYLNIIKTLII